MGSIKHYTKCHIIVNFFRLVGSLFFWFICCANSFFLLTYSYYRMSLKKCTRIMFTCSKIAVFSWKLLFFTSWWPYLERRTFRFTVNKNWCDLYLFLDLIILFTHKSLVYNTYVESWKTIAAIPCCSTTLHWPCFPQPITSTMQNLA